MAYDETKMGMGGEMGDGMEDKDSFYLPSDYPNSESLSTGDTITLKVVSKDEKTGEIEVCPCGGEQNWKTDLRSSMSEPTPEE